MYRYIRPSIGSDPEFFFYHKEDGILKLIPADKVLPSKDKKASISNNGFAFFDGVQAELNPHHSTCREIHSSHISNNLFDCYDIARRKLKIKDPKDFYIVPYPSIDVNIDELEGCDEECFRFGCAPSNSIYPMREIKYPDGHTFTKRFAGGHIHLGFDSIEVMRKMNNPDMLERFIKMSDILAGIIGTAMAYNDRERIRRKYYGRAGEYRIQKHGIEYRTLSNFWLVAPELTSLMTGIVRDALRLTYGDMADRFINKVDMKEIVRVINKVDNIRAREIYNEVILPYYQRRVSKGNSCPLSSPEIRNVVEHLMNVGVDNVFKPENTKYYHNIVPCNYKPTWLERGSCWGIHKFSRSIARGDFDYDNVANQE